MKPKQILVLALLFFALFVGIILKQNQKVPELSTEEYAPLDLSFDVSKAAKLEIFKGKDEKLVDVAKTNAGWRVLNFHNARADQEKINDLFKAINAAKGEMRAKDKNLFADFGIADESAYRLVISNAANAALLSVKLGTKKPAYSAVFLRAGNSENVYYVATDLFSHLGVYDDPNKVAPKSDYWVSVKLVEFQAEEVNQIQNTRFENGHDLVTAHAVRKTDSNDLTKKKWQFELANSPFPIEGEKVKQFLNSVKTWQALKASDPKAQDYGFDKPIVSFKLGFEDGKEILIQAGAENPTNKARYIWVSSEPVVFELPDYYFKNLNIDDSKFFIENPLGVDPQKTTKLIVNLGSKKLDISVKEKVSDALTNYLTKLKTFSVARLLFQEADIKKLSSSGAAKSLAIYKENGEALTLEVGAMVGDQPKEYAARVSNKGNAFAISEAIYRFLFENEGLFNSN